MTKAAAIQDIDNYKTQLTQEVNIRQEGRKDGGKNVFLQSRYLHK